MLWCFTVAVAGGVVGLVLGDIRLPIGGRPGRRIATAAQAVS